MHRGAHGSSRIEGRRDRRTPAEPRARDVTTDRSGAMLTHPGGEGRARARCGQASASPCSLGDSVPQGADGRARHRARICRNRGSLAKLGRSSGAICAAAELPLGCRECGRGPTFSLSSRLPQAGGQSEQTGRSRDRSGSDSRPRGELRRTNGRIARHLRLTVPERSRVRVKPPAATATDLATLAACRLRFLRGPFVGRALLMGGASSLAGNLALLLRSHRGEAPALLLVLSVHPIASLN